MGFWDDVKKAAGNARDAVEDAFDGDDEPRRRQAPRGQRPQADPDYKGNVFRAVNAAFKKREHEFEKPLWMTGADRQSPYNSWDSGTLDEDGTSFLDRMFKQQEELAKLGKLGDQFEDETKASGVVTFDHITKDGKDLRFGDVFDKGKYVGNLYEDKEGTEADADLMMGQLLLEPEELAQIGEDRDPTRRLRGTLDEVRQNLNVEMPQRLAAAEQQQEVDTTQEKIQQAFGGKGDDYLAGGLGAAGGAVLTGGLALSSSGVGIVPGLFLTAAGAGVSGLAAWLNRDDISEQAASAYEISRQAYDDDQGNVVGDTASAVKQGAGLLGRGLSPLSNLTRGLIDEDRGNGVGALQEEDRPGWAKPLDIAATIGDMGLTFGSTAGITAYTGQMGAHTAGSVAELTAGGGWRWDAQAGSFRNVYEDEGGDFSAANAAGAWGSTAIDFAQLAMVRGIAQKISGADTKMIGRELNGKKVASVEQSGARSFYKDDAGEVIGSKVNFAQAFVPSEGVQLLASSGMARSALAKRSGAAGLKPDDLTKELYKQSTALARAEAPIKAALVNAVGEGTEEAVQEALDTWSFDHKVDLQTLAEAYAYGAASGLGMGFAANMRTRRNDDLQMSALTRSGYELQNGPIGDAEWGELYKNGLTDQQRAEYRAMNFSEEEKQALKQALGSSAQEQGGSTASGLIITNQVAKAIELEQDKLTSKTGVGGRTIMRAGANQFQSLKVRDAAGSVKIENGAVADDSGATGFTGLLTQYSEKLKRLPEILESIDGQIAAATAEKTRFEEAGAETGEVDALIAKLQDTRDLWAGTEETLTQIIEQMQTLAEGLLKPLPEGISDEQKLEINAAKRRDVDKINQYLDKLYRSDNDSVALAAAKFRLRPPFDNVGSFSVSAPALDWSMVLDGFDGTETIDWAALDTTTADFDGDRITGTTSLVLGRNGFQRARAGLTWVNTAPNSEGVQTTSYKVASTAYDESILVNLQLVHKGGRTPAAQDSPVRGITKFTELVAARYGLPANQAEQMRDALVDKLLKSETDEPIETLMAYFAQVENPVAQRMINFAQSNRTNEASIITGIYRAAMDQAATEVNEARKATEPQRQRAKTFAPDPNILNIGQTKNSQQGATLYSTFMQYYGSQDSLRVGQVLRLSGEDYTDIGVVKADKVPLLVQAGAELRLLAQGKIEAAYKGGLDPFDVTARVHEMALDITGNNSTEAFELLTREFGSANWDGKEAIDAKYGVTVAQALTESVITQLRRVGAQAISRDVDLENKLRLLETAARDTQDPSKTTRATGELMILKDALGMFTVSDVAGIGSTAGWETSGLLPNGTILQNVRILGKHTRESRTAIKKAMLDFADNSSSPDTYRAMVNFIHELANSEYSVDLKTGKVHGRLADRNEKSSKAALEIRHNVIEATQALGLDLTHEGVLEALSTQNGQEILEAFIKQTGIASFTRNAEGTYVPRSWVLDFFTTQKDGEAEVLLWRNRAYTALHLASTRKELAEQIRDDEEKAAYTRIDDSLARLMFYLREQSPKLLAELEIELSRATSREALEEWINLHAYSFGVPVMMYENSMAQFDPSLAGGGWSAGQTTFGTDIREVALASRTFVARTKQTVERHDVNVAAMTRLQALLADANNGMVASARDSLREAAKVDEFKTMDPNDAQESSTLIHQFGIDMHKKGGEPESVAAHVAQQIAGLIQTGRADPFVDSTNVALGVLDLQDLRARPELIFTTSQFRDDFGRLVTVPPMLDENGEPSLELVLKAALDDKRLVDIIAEAWLPRAHKYNRAADIATIVHRGPTNLQQLFEQRFDRAFAVSENGQYTVEANMAFGVEVTAIAQTNDQLQVAAFERGLLAVATPRIISSRDSLESSDIAKINDESHYQLSTVLRMIGQYINSTEGSKDLFRAHLENAAKELRAAQVAGQRKRQEDAGRFRTTAAKSSAELDEAIETALLNTGQAAVDSQELRALKERIAGGRYTKAQQDALLQEIIAAPNSAPIVKLFQSAVNGDPYGDFEYLYGSKDVQSEDQKQRIAEWLTANPNIDSQVLHDPKAQTALAYFRDDTVPFAEQKWDVLRNIAISVQIHQESNPVTSQSDFIVVFDDPTRQDPTFSLLLKDLLDPDGPLVTAAVGITRDHVVPVDVPALQRAMAALFPAEGEIRWDQSIGAMTEALSSIYPSLSAGKAAGIHGNTGKTADAMAMAARTNTVDVPPEEYLQTVRIRHTKDGIRIISSDELPIDAEMLDGAIGIVDGKILDPMVIEGVVAPYQGMTHARLERVLAIGEEADVRFFHPMHRPSGAKWHNSVYFDGVAAHNSGLVPEFPSLIAEMYMQPNGITQRGTRFTLDAVKEKLPALYRTAMTPQGGLDLSRIADPTNYLSSIATLLSGTDLGYGTLGDTWYRAILKYVTMRHIIMYADGTASSVYEYMAQRDRDPDAMAARGAQLVPLSERTANTLYGEVGIQGLRGFPPSGELAYGQRLFSWDALTDRAQEVLRNLSEPIELAATPVARRSALGSASRGSQAEYRTAVRDFGKLYELQAQAAAVQDERRTKFHSMGLNIDSMAANVRDSANTGMVNDQQVAGLQILPDGFESFVTGLSHRNNDFVSGASFHVVLSKKGDYHDGFINPTNFGAFTKNLGDMTFGDSIALDLDQFTDRDLEDVMKIVRYMVGRKVTIVVRGGKGGDVRPAVQAALYGASDYAPVEGMTGTFAPIEALAVYAMERAYVSRAMEQRNTSAESRLLTFIPNEGQVGFGAIGESAAAIINPGKRQVVRNLLLKQFTSEYTTPIHRADQALIRDLILEPEFLEGLRNAKVEGEIAGLSHEDAVQDLIDRAKDGNLPLNSKNLILRKGMFEVYVVNAASAGDRPKVYLHRVGSKFIKEEALRKFRKQSAAGFILGRVETEPQQTFVEGRVMDKGQMRGDGLILRVESDQFWRNNKLIPHTGGNKVMTQALAEDLAWLREQIARDLSLDLVTNATDSMKKLSMMDSVRDFASAAELLGFDNMAVFFEGAYGVKYDANAPGAQERMSALRAMLNNVARNQDGRHEDVEAMVEFLAKGLVSDHRIVALTTLADPDSELTERLGQQDLGRPHMRVLLAAMAYLTLPNSKLQDIEVAGGFTSADARRPDRGSRRMPNLFTRIYDEASDIKEIALQEFGGRMEDHVELLDDYSVRIHHGTQFTEGRIAFSNYSVVGEAQGDNYDATLRQSVSSHDSKLLEQAADAFFANSYDAAVFNQFLENVTTTDTTSMFRTGGGTERRPWHNVGMAQQFYRATWADRLAPFFDTINLADDESASDTDIREVEAEIRRVAKFLFRDDTGRSDRHVHTMIRMMLGRPGASKADETEAAKIGLSKVRLALEAIEGNALAGYSPLRRGAVSLVPLEIRNALITANLGKEGGYKPRVWTGKRLGGEFASTVDTWTRAFFDHSLADPEANNIDAFNGIMDAVYHQYQQTSADALSLPVSLNLARDLKLISMDFQAEKALLSAIEEETTMAEFVREFPGALTTSLFRGQELQLTPAVLHTMTRSATLAQKIGLNDTEFIDPTPPTQEVFEYVEARLAAYARNQDIPYPTRRSTRQVMDSGAALNDNESNSHKIFRNLLALHAGKALFNPPLMLGAMIDSRMRMVVADARRMATGESIGPVGRRMASIVERQGPIGALARGLGWRVMYTPQQIDDFNRILNTTALTGPMNEVIYKELASYSAQLNEQGVWAPISKLNKLAIAMQDIGHGTKGKAMRSSYLQVAIADLVLRQGQDLDTVLSSIAMDGAWIAKNFTDSHNAGVQAMNDLRGTQETVISSAVSAVIRPLTHSSNAGVNATAQMTLAMPLMFQRYAANLFLTLTGFRAFDQLAAHALNGRQKPGFWQAISARASGRAEDPDPVIDMSDVIGGLDAMDAVINMGVTHSLLFTGGMVLGGLGLSGEDEEEKRRRRAAEAQGMPWLSDPREIENDFRNAHALFLDEIPGLNTIFRSKSSGRSMASPHWILKPLVSPILGMERFFETGDIRQLKWGFEDAITSFPLFNMITLNKAMTMSEELAHAAQDSAAQGNSGASDSAAFMTHLVSYYEHALFESSFLNALYVGFDEYDRDPYKMPLRDSDGDLQRDAQGNTRANEDQHLSSEGLNGRGLALDTYVDEDGKVQQGYWRESGAMTDSRVLAENRLSFAVISSLFTGLSGKGTNTRFDQAVKTRKIDKPKLTGDEKVEAFLRAVAKEKGEKLLKANAEGEDPTVEEALALSFIDSTGKEVLTDEGKMAVFRGLTGGSVTADDQALLGVYLTHEDRTMLQDKMLDELTMEGMRLGLSEASAKYRAGRVWYGNGAAPGMSQILWDKNIIPYSQVQEFQQLNTTNIVGPDGNVWATGFSRAKLLGAMGLAPLQGMHTEEDTHSDQDNRMNVSAFGVNNTGMRSLRPVNDSLDTPTDAEIGDAITRAIEDLNNRSFGSGFGGGGGFGGFGGGGGSYAQRPVNFYPDVARWTNRNYNPFVIKVPFANDVYSVRTDDVRTDLSLIRRERISSERSRLTQWQ